MLDVRINGKRVDIYDNDVTISFENFRFADAIPDQFSTDIELPKTNNNLTIFDAVGLLSRGGQFANRYECSISLNNEPSDGYIQITAVKKESVTATLFFSNFPYSLLDKNIADVCTDSNVSRTINGITVAPTIVPWRSPLFSTNVELSNSALSGYVYNCGNWSDIGRLCNRHPQMQLVTMLNQLEAFTGVGMPGVTNEGFIVPTKKDVCPQNDVIWVIGSVKNGECKLYGGQHVCIDMEIDPVTTNNNLNDNIWATLNASDYTRLTFNRPCTIHVDAWAAAGSPNAGDFIARQYYADGTATIHHASQHCWSYNHNLYDMDDYENFQNAYFDISAGDYISFDLSTFLHKCGFVVKLTISDYDIKDEDYGTKLIYSPFEVVMPAFDGNTKTIEHFATDTDKRAFSYYGFYCNLPDVSIRDLINSLCWAYDGKIKLSNRGMTFTRTDVFTKIDAEIDEIAPICDKLGQSNIITYLDSENPQNWTISNEFLNDSATVHESIFYGCSNVPDTLYYIIGKLPQYSVEDGKAEFEEIDGLVLMDLQGDNNVIRLCKPHELYTLGLEHIQYVMQISGHCYDNLINTDYILHDGRTFMMVDGDYDTKTGLCNFNALEVGDTSWQQEPQKKIFAACRLDGVEGNEKDGYDYDVRVIIFGDSVTSYGVSYYISGLGSWQTVTMNTTNITIHVPAGEFAFVYAWATDGTYTTPVPQNKIMLDHE